VARQKRANRAQQLGKTGKPKATRGKQAWVSLAGYTEPENAGAWNGCLI
jgi:hypothetical protein